ncbi:MAG: YafY family transcriptional regulator [Chitinophagaceae bacterium]|nr:YafY family transcriptional regulator [Chitinophagaceae bacterium]
MNENDTKRLSRLTAILTQLQTQRLLTATSLADKFNVSIRTIYRDIRALEQAGVPIVTEDGKGYTLMEHYRLPPVTLTESEANALITAEQIILKNKDASFVKAYSEAITKIKAVLRHSVKDKANLLAERIYFTENKTDEKTSNHLLSVQYALTNFFQTAITYTNEANNVTDRIVEPFALLSTQEKWLLIGWCRLRNTFRFFRLDRINKLTVLSEKFEPHKLTLQEYFEKYH